MIQSFCSKVQFKLKKQLKQRNPVFLACKRKVTKLDAIFVEINPVKTVQRTNESFLKLTVTTQKTLKEVPFVNYANVNS